MTYEQDYESFKEQHYPSYKAKKDQMRGEIKRELLKEHPRTRSLDKQLLNTFVEMELSRCKFYEKPQRDVRNYFGGF